MSTPIDFIDKAVIYLSLAKGTVTNTNDPVLLDAEAYINQAMSRLISLVRSMSQNNKHIHLHEGSLGLVNQDVRKMQDTLKQSLLKQQGLTEEELKERTKPKTAGTSEQPKVTEMPSQPSNKGWTAGKAE